MDTQEIESKVKETISKGAKSTKEAFEKVGNKIQDFTDKSVVKMEIRQLENKRDCKYEELGLKVSELLLQGAKITFNKTDEVEMVEELQKEIKDFTAKIAEKEKLL